VYKHPQHKCGSEFESDGISNVLPFVSLNSSNREKAKYKKRRVTGGKQRNKRWNSTYRHVKCRYGNIFTARWESALNIRSFRSDFEASECLRFSPQAKNGERMTNVLGMACWITQNTAQLRHPLGIFAFSYINRLFAQYR